MSVELHLGDCLEVMRSMPDKSVDTIITDPPYGLTFMGKDWDRGVPGVAFWEQALRVAKPGAMLLAMGGTRTFHRLVVAIEDAGWEVRDSMAWLYGSGFPKSYDISKGIDKARTEDYEPAADVARWLVDQLEKRGLSRRDVTEHFGAANIAQQWTTHWTDGAVKPRVPKWEQWQELRRWLDLPAAMDAEVWRLNGRKGKPGDAYGEREVVGKHPQPASEIFNGGKLSKDVNITAPATPTAQLWHGWGTALKPAMELICVAMKPIDGTFVNNALTWGVAGLWIDGGRVEYKDGTSPEQIMRKYTGSNIGKDSPTNAFGVRDIKCTNPESTISGRFPANVIHDGSDEVTGLFPQSKSTGGSGEASQYPEYDGHTVGSHLIGKRAHMGGLGDSGSAARFFYCAKSSRSERNGGLEGINHHPTVKPLALMRYLARLTKTPTGGVVLDPFMGSGTTGMAAVMEGRDFIGIELNADYLEIAERRIAATLPPFGNSEIEEGE